MQEILKLFTPREQEVIAYIIGKIKEQGEFVYTVRQLTEDLKTHHKTLNKALDKAKESGYFVIEDLGLRRGYKISFSEKFESQGEIQKQVQDDKVKDEILRFAHDDGIVSGQDDSIVEGEKIFRLIGRDKEIEEILGEIKKRRNVLLFGTMGTGKTAILKYIYQALKSQNQKVIYADYSQSFKQFMVNVAREIHVNYQDLELHELIDKSEPTNDKEWRHIKRKVQRMITSDLVGLVIKAFKSKDYILICDHFESATPTSKSMFETIRDNSCLVCATKDVNSNNHLKKLYWRFKQIEIGNLNEKATRELISQHIKNKQIHIYKKKDFINKILNVSKGNCQSIHDLIYHAEKEKYIDRKHIREMGHEAGRKEIDLTLGLVFMLVFVVAARFFALGMNNKDLYIIAGVGGAFGLFLKLMLMQLRRKKSR